MPTRWDSRRPDFRPCRTPGHAGINVSKNPCPKCGYVDPQASLESVSLNPQIPGQLQMGERQLELEVR